MKKNYFLLLFLWLFLFPSFIYAADNFQLITNSDNGDYIGQWTNWVFSDSDDSIKNINAADKNLTFGIENFNMWIINFSFGSPDNLQKWLYYPAKRYPFRWSFNWIDISGNWRWCNEILWWFYVHEYKIDSSWKLEKAAIDFVQYCEKGSKWLYGSFRYNSSVSLSCTNSNCDEAKRLLNIDDSNDDDSNDDDSNDDDSNDDDSNDDDSNDDDSNINLSQELVEKIFKIQAYSYNSTFDIYTLEQYWSAVLVWKNLLITNAHVITNSDWSLMSNYEVCQTTSIKEIPKCFSALKLLRYDTKNDLALLEIKTTNKDIPSPVKFWSKDLSLWTKINILWYPANWWNTITATQWTIAWFQNWLYKTDASLDEWNSGGGAFDNDDNFVWIPSFLVNWETALWYIIPIDRINSFMKWNIWTASKKSIDPKFEKYLKDSYSIREKWIINNDLFSTDNFKELWFSLIWATEKKQNNLYTYDLMDNDWNIISLWSVVFSKNMEVKKYVNGFLLDLKQSWMSLKQQTKKIGGIDWIVVSYENDGEVWYIYTQSNPTSNTFIEYWLFVEKSNKNLIKDWLKFLENIKIKKINNASKSVDMPWIKLSTKWNIGIFKYLWNDWIDLSIIPSNENFSVYVSSKVIWGKVSLKDIVTSSKTILSELWYTVKIEPLKNLYIVYLTDPEWNYSVGCIWMTTEKNVNVMISMSASLKSKKYEKEAIALFQKILPQKPNKK